MWWGQINFAYMKEVHTIGEEPQNYKSGNLYRNWCSAASLLSWGGEKNLHSFMLINSLQERFLRLLQLFGIQMNGSWLHSLLKGKHISLRRKWKWSHSVLCSVVSDFWRPHRLQPTRFLRPWDFPGKSTGAGCHFLQRIFPTQGSNPSLPHCRQTRYPLSHQGSSSIRECIFLMTYRLSGDSAFKNTYNSLNYNSPLFLCFSFTKV